jgi:hypothetical protein
MKLIKLVLVLPFVFLLYNCSDENNPVSSYSGNNYVGGIGTERTYHETEKWFLANSTVPYFTVPESLLTKVSLTSSQLQSGVACIKNYTAFINPIDDAFYISWNLPLPRENYIQTEANGKEYSLENELDSLKNNKSYTPGNFGIGQEIFRVTEEGIMTVNTPDLQANFPSVPFIKNNLQVNDCWVRYKYIDTTTNNPIFETIANVISKEYVVVPAATFNAYKVKLTTYHYNPDYSFDEGYEYYVPGVGLVLKESDMDLYRWDSGTNTTIHFRQIIRKELVSYYFVQ